MELCERRTGHRNVGEEVAAEAGRPMDAEDSGEVSQDAFLAYLSGSKRATLKVLSFGPEGDGVRGDELDDPPFLIRRGAGVSRAAAPPE